MELTTIIKWHNLLENPDDLPDGSRLYIVAFLIDDKIIIHGFNELWRYSTNKDLFYYDYYHDDGQDERIYSDDAEIVEDCGQIVCWAECPMFYDMEKALGKEILSKEDAKND